MEWMTNAAGRSIPLEIEGRRLRPRMYGTGSGASKVFPHASTRGKPEKLAASWDDLFDRMDMRDGMTISFHHHLRDGDAIVNEVIARLAVRGLRNLIIAPSALFSIHAMLVPYIESGVIARVEGSMYGAVGIACSRGAMRGLSVLRSHGGRQRAIQDGDLHIDAAFIAAPSADAFGNASGRYGRSACGPLAYPVPAAFHFRWQCRPCARRGLDRRQYKNSFWFYTPYPQPDTIAHRQAHRPVH